MTGERFYMSQPLSLFYHGHILEVYYIETSLAGSFYTSWSILLEPSIDIRCREAIEKASSIESFVLSFWCSLQKNPLLKKGSFPYAHEVL